MAHIRSRYLISDFAQLLKFSPLVGLLGHRQVGKTTFVQGLVDKYVTFDSTNSRNEATNNPAEFVKENSKQRTVIDECQLVPSIFPELKEWVRVHKKPGQFVLTGSVRFSSKKAIRESLTGRISNLELLPLSIGELEQIPLRQSLETLLRSNHLESFCANHESELELTRKHIKPELSRYLVHGGLPGICFIRQENIRQRHLSDLLSLILDRDLRQIHKTTLSLQTLQDFIRYIADHEGLPFNYSHAERAIRLSDTTQKNLLYALESIFLIRRVKIEGGTNSKTYYLEDQAEFSHFRTKQDEINSLEGLVFRNARVQFHYGLKNPYSITQHLSRSKSRVPFVFHQNNQALGLKVIESDKPTLADIQSGNSFLKTNGSAKLLFVSSLINHFEILNERSLVAPLHWIG
jgi:predicted AAA+ superfamily ATPase